MVAMFSYHIFQRTKLVQMLSFLFDEENKTDFALFTCEVLYSKYHKNVLQQERRIKSKCCVEQRTVNLIQTAREK